jgi:hypothetical protein
MVEHIFTKVLRFHSALHRYHDTTAVVIADAASRREDICDVSCWEHRGEEIQNGSPWKVGVHMTEEDMTNSARR